MPLFFSRIFCREKSIYSTKYSSRMHLKRRFTMKQQNPSFRTYWPDIMERYLHMVKRRRVKLTLWKVSLVSVHLQLKNLL